MAELKTKRTKKSVTAFLNSVEDENKRKDSFEILKLMKAITKAKPEMWGESIVGFGKYHYKYASGQERDWPLAGFSPRKQNLTFYIMPGFTRYNSLLNQLGKYKTGASCLYIKSLADVDKNALRELIEKSYALMCEKYRL